MQLVTATETFESNQGERQADFVRRIFGGNAVYASDFALQVGVMAVGTILNVPNPNDWIRAEGTEVTTVTLTF